MSEKVLERVWLVADMIPGAEPTYYAGNSKVTGRPCFGALSGSTRTYKSGRAADSARRLVGEAWESPFLRTLYYESISYSADDESDAVEPQTDEQPRELPEASPLAAVPEGERRGWVVLDKLCGLYPYMLRKRCGDVMRYAVAFSAADMWYLPAIEGRAWDRYFDECKQFVRCKIQARGGSPDGGNEWKKEAGK